MKHSLHRANAQTGPPGHFSDTEATQSRHDEEEKPKLLGVVICVQYVSGPSQASRDVVEAVCCFPDVRDRGGLDVATFQQADGASSAALTLGESRPPQISPSELGPSRCDATRPGPFPPRSFRQRGAGRSRQTTRPCLPEVDDLEGAGRISA